MQIPEKTTHLFVNTKNKKSFYSNKADGSWEIFNKGLGTWEKVPSLDLNLIPINIYLQSELSSQFTDIENTTIDITSVTTKNKQTSISELSLSFVAPPITPEDYLLIYELFEKHSPEGYPLGFVNGEANHSVLYDHQAKKWYEVTSFNAEYLTVYTTDLDTVKKVVNELNTSLLTTHLTK